MKLPLSLYILLVLCSVSSHLPLSFAVLQRGSGSISPPAPPATDFGDGGWPRSFCRLYPDEFYYRFVYPTHNVTLAIRDFFGVYHPLRRWRECITHYRPVCFENPYPDALWTTPAVSAGRIKFTERIISNDNLLFVCGPHDAWWNVFSRWLCMLLKVADDATETFLIELGNKLSLLTLICESYRPTREKSNWVKLDSIITDMVNAGSRIGSNDDLVKIILITLIVVLAV